MRRRLENKVALVTGAGSGIGKASALAFAREGAKVVVEDIVVDAGEQTANAIMESGGEATFIKADVARAAEVEAMINKTVELYGRLDCAYNNAGLAVSPRLTTDTAEEDWDRLMNVNLKGVWLCMK
jgi:NAD(P)-dependent dehydrogenase (short-subunit alcohol dehydrogenase family)